MKDYLQGKVKIDEYVTHHRTLSDINEGFHDMHVSRFKAELRRFADYLHLHLIQGGDCIRCVVDMS